MKINILDSKNSANYDNFSLVSGGLIYSLTAVFRKKGNSKRNLLNTAIALAMITWLPLGLLAIYYDTFTDDNTSISFFEDFLVHVRFLFIVPFLILIEKMVDRTFIEYVKNSDDIIPNSQQTKYNNLVKRLDKLTNSFLPEIIVLVVYYIAIFTDPQLISAEDAGRNYLTYTGTNTLNIAGWYNYLFCVPIFLLLTFRWTWRWIIWAYSLIKISHFKLFIDPLHADKMVGLGYLNLVPLTFSFILIAPSTMMSAVIGIDIIYNGVSLMSYYQLILFFVILSPIIMYSPLFVFMPKLINARRDGILLFGDLVRKHNQDYVNKWIDGEPGQDESILGTMDNSSLADINGSYAPIEGSKLFPIDLKMIVISFIINVIPYIPLVFTYYSFTELFELFTKSLMSG